MKKMRIQWIDFAKGIAILLVIIGHTVKNENIVFQFTHSICRYFLP